MRDRMLCRIQGVLANASTTVSSQSGPDAPVFVLSWHAEILSGRSPWEADVLPLNYARIFQSPYA